MKRPIRILYLTSYSPAERPYGAQLRTYHIATALQALGQLDCVVVQHDDDQTLAPDPGSSIRVQRVIKLRPTAARSPWERLRCGLDARFVNYYGHSVAEQERMSVLSQVPAYDLVWLHHLHTANVFAQWSWPRSVLDLDDIPSSFYRTERQSGGGLARRLRAGFRMQMAKRRERLLGERFTVLSVCSDEDRRYLGLGGKVHVIPNGFERPAGEPLRRVVTPPRIGFIGRFDHRPNADGIHWFARECWPHVKQAVPDCRLRLVGKDSDGSLKPAGRDIDALGWLPDPAEEIATWSTMIVPVRLGAGTRIKIAEAFSRKCPVVSTPLGAYGYEVQDGRELLLADDPAAIANACVSLLRDQTRGSALAECAWQQFLKKWTWDSITPRILAAAEDCLQQSRLPPG
jgi:glycosyltransferase involved in cell wall biosynthesis